MAFKSYNEQIKQLSVCITDMGQLVKQMIEVAFESLTAKDDAHKAQLKELDKKVNELDRNINEQSAMMLAMRSPMGDDLRFVISALGIASDLERSGDLAKNISKRSLKIGDYNPIEIIKQIGEMVVIITTMIDDAIKSVETRNPDLAISVWKRDKEVDRIYDAVLRDLQIEISKNNASVEAVTHLMFANKNLERIADYSTSLARTVYYVTSGKPATKQLIKSDA
jgi:phosphate transport system protein